MDFIQWVDTDKTALYIQAPQTISDDDVKAILRQITTMTRTVDHPVTLIIDRRKTVNVPRKTMISMRKVVANHPWQHIVLIGFSMLPKMLVETLTRLPGVFSTDPIFVESLEEAYETLDITDPILDDTPQA